MEDVAHVLVFHLFEFLWNQNIPNICQKQPSHPFADAPSNYFVQYLQDRYYNDPQMSTENALKCFRKSQKFKVQDFLVYFDIGAMIETMLALPIWQQHQDLIEPIKVLRRLRNETSHIRVVPDQRFYDKWLQNGYDSCLRVVGAMSDKKKAAKRLAEDINRARSSFTRSELEQQVERHIQKATRRDLLSEINALVSMNVVSPVLSTSIEYARDICGEFVTKVSALI